jgi:hypothetical protein
MVMTAENHSTEEVVLVRGVERWRIDGREITRAARNDKILFGVRDRDKSQRHIEEKGLARVW